MVPENAVVEVETVTLVIDGFEVTVPKGTLVIRAAEKLGIQIPRFCDHPLLEPAGACRQCLVDIEINGLDETSDDTVVQHRRFKHLQPILRTNLFLHVASVFVTVENSWPFKIISYTFAI